MSVDSLHGFNTEKFRDKFKLSHNQANDIIDHLKKNTIPEGGLQNKFFKAKRYVEESLYSSMDLTNSSQKLQVNFPEGSDTWPELEVILGGSGSGKSYHILSKCLRCLNDKEKNRRNILWISNEWNIDKTLEPLKHEKYAKYVQGIDVSEETFEASEHTDPQSFYDQEVKPAIHNLQKGSVCVIDDSMDTPIRKQLLFKINKMLRCVRHKSIGLAYILHRIRSGLWSQQASSSCKYFTIFPKSGKGKCVEFLKDQGFTSREARDTILDFSDSDCRAMICRLHAPQCLINEKLIRLF